MSTGFQFKQFFVNHDRCAMKVGTDGVLLGSWCPTPQSKMQDAKCKILDVGTGSGLIALMLAQRCPEAQIDAIDIDAAACTQAAENFASSPWAERLHATPCSLQDWQMVNGKCENGKLYDLIVSNPPYFVDSLKNPDAARSTARHNDTLPFGELIETSTQMLAPDGKLAVIVPAEVEQVLQDLAATNGLHCMLRCYVHPKPGRPAKRVMIAWSRTPAPEPTECTGHLTLEDEQGGRSEAYQQLTREFYL